MKKIIDLSLPFTDGMRGLEITPKTRFETDGYQTTTLHLYSHTGTHMDAPLHWIKGGRTMDHLDLNKCVGDALVVDLSHKEPNSFITIEDLEPWKDKIVPGTRLLIRSDWSDHAELEDYRTSFPRVSVALAGWLVEREIWLLGLETPSVASLEIFEELQKVHQILLAAEIVIVECLANLRTLPEEIFFASLPLKVVGGDGSPARPIAMV